MNELRTFHASTIVAPFRVARPLPILWVLLLAPIIGCGYRTRSQAIARADLATPERTRVTNYMSAPLRPGSPTEETPESVSRSVLLDEARIARLADDEVCFDVVVRTESGLDTALSEMRVLIGGKQARVGEETITVRDHAWSGERDVLVANAVTASALASLRLTEPAERLFRVFERSGRVCRARPTRDVKRLELEIVIVKDDDRGNWGETFVWVIE
jgi:hypothetical protein